MSSVLLTATLAVALGQFPQGGGPGCSTCQQGGAGGSYVGSGAGYVSGGYVDGGAGSGGFSGGAPGIPGGGASTQGAEQLYNYDAREPWIHGHFQEIPAYGGYFSFRPYNYKHVLSQSQVAGGWGMSPTMPYSHEYFRRAREHGHFEQRTSALPMETGKVRSDPVRWMRQRELFGVGENAPPHEATIRGPVMYQGTPSVPETGPALATPPRSFRLE